MVLRVPRPLAHPQTLTGFIQPWKTAKVILFSTIITACSAPSTPPQEKTKAAEPPPPERVNQLSLQMQRAYPLKLNAIIQGKRLEQCEQLEDIQISQLETAFQLTLIFAPQQAAPPCDAILPFEHIVPLPLAGLSAGFYTVNIDGLTAMFELPVDIPK